MKLNIFDVNKIKEIYNSTFNSSFNYGEMILIREYCESNSENRDNHSLPWINLTTFHSFRCIDESGILKSKKDDCFIITDKDRSPLVRDMNYGDIETHDMQGRDIPKFATVEYVDNNLVYEDYKELDEFLERKFIPKNVALMKKVNADDPSEKRYPYIQLNKIIKLKLSELEIKHVIEYLNNQGIYVRGIDSTVEQDFKNYEFYRTYKNQKLPNSITADETLIKLRNYYGTHDKKLREEIIMDNSRLVPWIAYKYSIRYGIDSKQLEGYGYEGLIRSIDKFDITLGYKFSTFATVYIRCYIKMGICELYTRENKRNKWIIDYIRCKRIVEETLDKKIEDDLSLSNEITKLMVADGSISPYSYDLNVQRINMLYAESYECLDEDYQVGDDIPEYETSDDKVYNEQLRECIYECMETLSEREQLVIKLRYGFEEEKRYSLSDISKILKVSPGRVRQIEIRAIKKLGSFECGKKLSKILKK